MKKKNIYIIHLISGLLGITFFLIIFLLKEDFVYIAIAVAFGIIILIIDHLYERIKMEINLK